MMECNVCPPVLKDGDDHDWPEGLLLCNHHVILNMSKDGRLHEEPWEGRWIVTPQSSTISYLARWKATV